MHESTKTVNCDQHGKQQETFVCEHLLYGEKLGFHIADDDSAIRDQTHGVLIANSYARSLEIGLTKQ